ncbi:MAG: peptidoglycan-binding protein, partial [Bacteroidales bacterium]
QEMDSFEDFSDNYFTITSSITPILKISGIAGPTTLNVGQRGEWEIEAEYSGNQILTYSVNWGDDIVYCPSGGGPCTGVAATQLPQQSATFTHSYTNTGTYYPTFTVTNNSGQTAKTSLSVNVVGIIISTNSNPVLGPIAVPISVNVGKSTNFYFSATDADNDNLCWSIDWGENSGGVGACSTSNLQQKQGWTYNPNYTWNTAGTYNIKVTVFDSRGGSAFSSFNVNVIASITCTSTTNVVEAALGNPGGTGPFEKLGLDISAHPEILKYRIQWSNGGWSDWYVPGVDDQDWLNNLDGTARRIWSYFDDHTHEYIKCLSSTSSGGSGGSTTSRSGVSSIAGSSLTANALGALNEENSQTGNAPAFVESSCGKFTMTLSKGMVNSEVKCLKKMLIEKSFKIEGVKKGEETDYFSYDTMMTLKKFQTANGLKADGIFGPITREALVK